MIQDKQTFSTHQAAQLPSQSTQSSSLTQLTTNQSGTSKLQPYKTHNNLIHPYSSSILFSDPQSHNKEIAWPSVDTNSLSVAGSFYNTLFSAGSQSHIDKNKEFINSNISNSFHNKYIFSPKVFTSQKPIFSITSSYSVQPIFNSSTQPSSCLTQSAPNTPLMMMPLRPPFQGLFASLSKSEVPSLTDSEVSVDFYSSTDSSPRPSSPDSSSKIPLFSNHFIKNDNLPTASLLKTNDFMKDQSPIDSIFADPNYQQLQRLNLLHQQKLPYTQQHKHRHYFGHFEKPNYVDVTKAIRQMMKQNNRGKKIVTDTEESKENEDKKCSLNDQQHNTLKRAGMLNNTDKETIKSHNNKPDKNKNSESSSVCPYCFEGSFEGTDSSWNDERHRDNCPYLMHQEIMRLSKNATSKSDLEIGFCAKLSKSHLREQLKQRQQQQQLMHRSNPTNVQ